MQGFSRPISLTIFCWFLVGAGAWTLLALPLSLNSRGSMQLVQMMGISPTAMISLNIASSLLNLIAGIAMLRRHNAGRVLYLVGAPILLVATLIFYGFSFQVFVFLGMIVYGLFVVLLTRESVSDYFSRVEPAADDTPEFVAQNAILDTVTTKRLASVLLLIPGGVILICWMLLLFPLSDSLVSAMIISLVCGLLACAFVVPAIFLWGRRRWASVLGTLFAFVGGLLIAVALVFFEFTSMPQFRIFLVRLDPAILKEVTRGSLISGIAALMVGGLLLLLQRVNDGGQSTGADSI